MNMGFRVSTDLQFLSWFYFPFVEFCCALLHIHYFFFLSSCILKITMLLDVFLTSLDSVVLLTSLCTPLNLLLFDNWEVD